MRSTNRAGSALLALLLAALVLAGCLPAVQTPNPTAVPATAVPATEAPELVLLTPAPATGAPSATEAPTQAPSYTPALSPTPTAKPTPAPTEAPIAEDGYYYSRDEVALYIHTYGHLPDNFITKDEARDLGWTGGNVEAYAPEMAIGGDVFGNYEGLLPRARGRVYYECDIDTLGYRSRGSRRIIFSNDGLIYYTGNHYESFTLLYGEE